MGITGAAMLIALALLFFLMSGFAESKIPEGVTAGGVNLSGLSREEASAALESMIRQDMTVQLPVGEFTLSSEYTQVSLDMDGLLEEAFHQEKPAELSLRPWLILNEEALRKALITEIGEQEQAYSPAEARLEGTVPALNEQDFDPAIPCPTLTVQLGTPGTTASLDNLAALIADGYATATFRLDARELMQEQHPEAPDLAALRKEYSVEAVSAKVDPDTQEIIPGSYGLDFDMEAAEALLKEATPGEVIEIAMEYVTPEVLSGDVLFPDILGFCQTPHSDDEDRTHNLRLACAALNGVVLQPGETLSYNATLGQRTEEAGYKEAPAYSGTELVDSLGGGICQVSSTLYLCSLFAELETVERVSHGYPANYMPVGLDATVSWGSPDLKIKNSWDTR